MKNTQKQNKKAIYWGVLTFLTGAGLLFNVNHSQVEAIDLSNSHLGTFEGNTTFTTSSGTGVQPTLAIEVKNQDGSTQSYETSSGSLTIPNTQEGATIKRAILKGNTLVNLSAFNGYKTISVSPASSYVADFQKNIEVFKPNTKYLVVTEFQHDFKYKFGVTVSHSTTIFNETIRIEESNGSRVYKHIVSTKSDFTGCDSALRTVVYGNSTDEIIQTYQIMIIEYQEGVENWNLPYFEGMQFVQMPTLTITNGEPEQIKNEQGQWVPNPAFQSTAITFEEEIILRSNGEVYDELDLMTGKLTQRLDENNEVLAKPIVRAVNMKAEPVFKLVNQAEIAVVGDVKATMVSVTVPTAPLSFVLDPNKEPDQQFIASEFSLTNDTQAPLAIELKEFIQTTNLFNDVLPDYYDEWRDLTKEESKNISLGLVPQESESWLTLNPGTYYVADTKNAILGRVRSQSTVDFKFTALHGQAFDTTPQPQYRLTFVFGF